MISSSSPMRPSPCRSMSPRARLMNLLHSQGLFLLTAGFGITLSLALVPRGAELGLLNLEVGRTAEALEVLESRYASGDRSLSTVGALAEARARSGSVASAITLLEELLPENPKNIALLETLAKLFRQVGRNVDAARILSDLVAIRSTPQALRQLAAVYGLLERQEAQLAVLRELTRSPKAETGDIVALARLEGSLGDPLRGAEILAQLAALRPRQIDASIVALETSLRLAGGEIERAYRRAQAWLAKARTPRSDVLALASVFSNGRQPAIALSLLEPYARRDVTNELLTALLQVQIDVGQPREALMRLEAHAQSTRGRVSRNLELLRLNLAVSLSDAARTVEAVAAMDIADVPPARLASVARAAIAVRRPDIIASIRHFLESGTHELSAVVIGETWLALQERDRAIAWANAAAEAIESRDTAIRRARLEWSLQRKVQAQAILRTTLRAGDTPMERAEPIALEHLDEVSRLAIEFGLVSDASRFLSRLREARPSPEVDRAWARVVALSQPDAFCAWLMSQKRGTISTVFLREIIFLAADRKVYNVALKAAARLSVERGSDSDRMLLAELQTIVGVPWVRPLNPAVESQAASRSAPLLR
jgi:tetratricopeptide (TPR) repeat protein